MKIDIKRFYADYIKGDYTFIGEHHNVMEWLEIRKQAYKKFQKMFKLDNIDKLAPNDFEKFLHEKENKSWTKLYRQKPKMLADFANLKENLKYLLNEKIPIEERINNVVPKEARYHTEGMAEAVVTSILHAVFPDKYGVWNSRTKKALQLLNILPNWEDIDDHGKYYVKLLNKFKKLKDDLGTDLTDIDNFLAGIVNNPNVLIEYHIFSDYEDVIKYKDELDDVLKGKSLDELKEIISKKRTLERKDSSYKVLQRYREPAVKQYVLIRANGMCEVCGKEAPFKKDNGEKYLETHHIMPLAKDGDDSIENVCAVCPNCHKELHFGEKKDEISKKVQEKIKKIDPKGKKKK
jgi:predicted restriction endonuclease